MRRYFFHVYNHTGKALDEEGSELASEEAARGEALRSIRSIVCEEALTGLIDLRGEVRVADAQGGAVMTVPYREAFDLKLD